MSDILGVTIPAGVVPGQQIVVQTPDGQQIMAAVPYGLLPGSLMYVRYAKRPPPPVPLVMGEDVEEPEGGDADSAPTIVRSKATQMQGAPKQEELVPCAACCCTILSCYPSFPDCVGCYEKGTCTCIEIESLCCRAGMAQSSSVDSICVLNRSECECIKPTSCVKLQSQACCLNAAIAFPCDEEVPCMINLLSITCVKDYNFVCEFGKKLDALEVADEGNKA